MHIAAECCSLKGSVFACIPLLQTFVCLSWIRSSVFRSSGAGVCLCLSHSRTEKRTVSGCPFRGLALSSRKRTQKSTKDCCFQAFSAAGRLSQQKRLKSCRGSCRRSVFVSYNRKNQIQSQKTERSGRLPGFPVVLSGLWLFFCFLSKTERKTDVYSFTRSLLSLYHSRTSSMVSARHPSSKGTFRLASSISSRKGLVPPARHSFL